jgi:glycosyltransferase involved in cell wall biosynthesis
LPDHLDLVVVDNDPHESARSVCREFSLHHKIPVRYLAEARPGISRARNTAWNAAVHDLVLFLDDDQELPIECLENLNNEWSAWSSRSNVAGICLYKRNLFSQSMPRLYEKTKLWDWPEFSGGSPVAQNQFGTGGLLLQKAKVQVEGPFRPDLGEIGGEDAEFFQRISANGVEILQSEKSWVYEKVPAERMTFQYILRDRFRKGFCDAFRRRASIKYKLISLFYFLVALGLSGVSILRGRASWLRAVANLSRQFGKLGALLGWKLKFYGAVSEVQTNVLHVTHNIAQGGCERLLEQLSDELLDQGFVSHYFCYASSKIEGMGKELQSQGSPVTVYQKKPGIDWRLPFLLRSYVKKNGIKVVHSHDLGGLVYCAALRFLCPQIKLLHTEHTLHYWIDRPRYRMMWSLAGLVYNHVICVSKFVESTIRQKVPLLRRGHISTIYNGVDISRFQFRTANQVPAKLRIVNVGRISPEKNLMHVLEACVDLRQRGLDFEFHHAGSGDETLTNQVKEYVSRNRLESYVQLHGFQEDVTELMQKADVFVTASLTEGHPVAVLEAMASGVMVMASDIPAHRPFVESGVTLFPLRAGALADHIMSYAEAPNSYQGRVYRAREKVENFFSLQNMAQRYAVAYK